MQKFSLDDVLVEKYGSDKVMSSQEAFGIKDTIEKSIVNVTISGSTSDGEVIGFDIFDSDNTLENVKKPEVIIEDIHMYDNYGDILEK